VPAQTAHFAKLERSPSTVAGALHLHVPTVLLGDGLPLERAQLGLEQVRADVEVADLEEL
jgi:hypothetical protein